MIYWLIFDGGIGGDGFANMLEHANNIEPVDGLLTWRSQVTPSGKIRFHYPVWVEPSLWFRHHPDNFEYGIEELTSTFKSLIEKDANVVIPVHKYFFKLASKFKFQDIINHKNKKICLYSNDLDRVINDFIDKQPSSELSSEQAEQYRIDRKFYNVQALKSVPFRLLQQGDINFIDIDRTWSDWEYLNENLIKLGIDLPREMYEEYLDVSKRRPNL